ncbi:MAG TPA: tRNA-dihydrouridine synthase [Candidatus Binatia bacterium]
MNFWSEIQRPIIGLSPMDGVTDAAFRFITAKHGKPDVILTEFVNIQSALYSPQTLLKDLSYSEIERPIVAQIYGKTPELFYLVAHIVCALGFDGLDINMGCPAKKVAATGCGAALIRTPSLAREIIRAARQGIEDWHDGQTLTDLNLRADLITGIEQMNLARNGWKTPPERRRIPISVKTRLGYDQVIVEDWLGVLLEEELAAISLHGRTLEQGYRGEADWEAITRAVEIARPTGTLLIGNGDAQDLYDVYRRVQQTGVDGVLVGRGAQGDPWLFRHKNRVKKALRSGEKIFLPEPGISLAERFAVIVEHSEYFERFCEGSRFMAMRKHLTWYCRDFRGAAEMRATMTRANSADEVRCRLQEFARANSCEADGPRGPIREQQSESMAPSLSI